jgi:hypothetical protein
LIGDVQCDGVGVCADDWQEDQSEREEREEKEEEMQVAGR